MDATPPTTIKAFYVYWIQSDNRAYIGATVDPRRRLRQHNSILQGGSQRTRGRGPWRYMCVVGGFRTWHEALCFEWRWQYDTKRCRSVAGRRAALDTLMARERWTSNSPPSVDVPLVVEDEPTQYGLPPEAYVPPEVTPHAKAKKKRRRRFRRYLGTY